MRETTTATAQQSFFKYLATTGRAYAALAKVGISRGTYFLWRKTDPDFARRATETGQQRFLKYLAMTGRVSAAITKAGLSGKRYSKWRKTDPDFARRVADTKAETHAQRQDVFLRHFLRHLFKLGRILPALAADSHNHSPMDSHEHSPTPGSTVF